MSHVPSIVNVLHGAGKVLVSFDATNPDHRNAYRKFLVSGRHDKTLRFRLEDEFTNVPDLMKHRMAVAGLRALDELDNLSTQLAERNITLRRVEQPVHA